MLLCLLIYCKLYIYIQFIILVGTDNYYKYNVPNEEERHPILDIQILLPNFKKDINK